MTILSSSLKFEGIQISNINENHFILNMSPAAEFLKQADILFSYKAAQIGGGSVDLQKGSAEGSR